MFNRIAVAASLVGVLALTGTAFAGNNGGGTTKSSSSFSLVLLTQTAGTTAATSGPRWGDQLTFNVSTSAAQPSVVVNCSQNGSLVYTQFGFFYPAPQAPTFTLGSYAWTGGAADCTARLYYVNPAKGSSVTLATLAFAVGA